MVGYRGLDCYIKKHGKEEGEKKFAICEDRRKKRELREETNRTKSVSGTDEDIQNGDAIKCMACGCITTRLQWTHFAYKCSIKTISEYKQKFSDAPLVAPNLIKMTTVTKDGMLALYGEDEGLNRWNAYCEKQAISNSFEYKAEKFGFSKTDFDEYNASRAVTIENLTARHGEEEGLIRWNVYCERQRYTTTLEYFIEKYGETRGLSRYEEFCKGRNFAEKRRSKIEIEIFEILADFISETDFQHTVFLKNPYISPFDYGSHSVKKLIEFNGTYWHCDPRKYRPEDVHPQRQMTAKTIWGRDRAKRTYAFNQGYSVFVIWEHDWYNGREETLKNLMEWWNNG